MFSENKFFFHSNDVFFVFRVALAELVHYLGFYYALLIKPLLISQDLKRHYFLFLVVHALEDLSKRALAQSLGDLVPIGDVMAYIS